MNLNGRCWGPDVSKWRVVHDWRKLVGSGATFFAAKATEGVHTVDPTFRANQTGFLAQPEFTLGVWYHFFHCEKSPEDQADLFAKTVGVLGPRERLCLDFEGKSYEAIEPHVMQDHGLELLEAFFARLDALGVLAGTRPLLYTAARHWVAIGNPPWGRAAGIDLWVARYSDPPKLPAAIPSPWATWSIWQWTDGDHGVHFSVPGVGLCDVNVLAET